MPAQTIAIDIPCDVQSMDETGLPWALLREARDPSRIVPGALVITADEEDPAFARVHSLVVEGDETIVHLEIVPGDPMEYAEALQRARLLAG